jgi:aldose sugar dehydrogenase
MIDHPSRGRAALALAVLASLPLASTALGQTMSDASLTVSTVVASGSGLAQPTTMAFVAPNDFLVLEKATGRVRRVLNNALQPGFALDVHVNSTSERGMLGIAVAPGSPVRVFLYYTEADGADGGTALGNRVYRYDWTPGAGSGTLTNGAMILDLPVNPGPNHDAGVIVLDAQGRLYVMIGDLNRNGQLQNIPTGAAPDDTGVVLRVNQDGTAATGNPFTPYCSVTTTQTCTTTANCPAGQTCITQVARYFAYGIRNGFGLEFDRAPGGSLWQTENGPADFDEMNRIGAGMNGGWNRIHGPDALDPQNVSDLWHMPGAGITYSDPEFSWQAIQVPTGIVFPFATTWGTPYNTRVLVGTQGGNIYSFPLNAGRTGLDVAALPAALQDLVAANSTEANLVRIGQGFGGITDLQVGPDDHIYVVDIGGRVFRIAGPVPVTLQDFRIE